MWQFCSTWETTLGLSLLVAVAVTLSWVFPQVPTQIRSDPINYQTWLSAVQIQFKNWAQVLDVTGAFYVLDTIWFKALLAALAFVLLISLGEQVHTLLGTFRGRPAASPHQPTDRWTASPPASTEEIVSRIREEMDSLFARVRQETDGSATHFYGGQRDWAAIGPSFLLLGLLLAAVGLAVNGEWGWEQSSTQLWPGKPVALGPEAERTVEFLDGHSLTGTVQLRMQGNRDLYLEPGTTANLGSQRYRLVDEGGPLVELTVQRVNGDALTLYSYGVRTQPSEALVVPFSPATPADESAWLFIISEERLVGRLEWSNGASWSGMEDPSFQLWIFREGGQTVVGEQEFVARQGPNVITVDGLVFTLDVSRFVVVDVTHRPGLWVVRIGALLAALGLVLAAIPRQRIWCVVASGDEGPTVRIAGWLNGLPWQTRLRWTETLRRLQARIPGV